MTKHRLKCHPEPFQALYDGKKTHETRWEKDRKFEVGDVLNLEEWDPKINDYTGRELWLEVTYLSRGPDWGLPSLLCIMSVDLMPAP